MLSVAYFKGLNILFWPGEIIEAMEHVIFCIFYALGFLSIR